MLTTLWNGQVELVEKHLLDPLKWGPVLEGIRGGSGTLKEKRNRDGSVTITRERPRRIFVNSMSDLFHENVTDEMRDQIFAVMALCPQHIFQVLTKRPERMPAYMTSRGIHPGQIGIYEPMVEIADQRKIRMDFDCLKWPLQNVWLGVSIENQAAADERIPLLLQTPAAMRFASCEPLLGVIKLDRIEVIDEPAKPGDDTVDGYCIDAVNGTAFDDENGELSTDFDGEGPMERGLDWVICGGESGLGARPMHPDWARGLRDQCQASGVPFFFKSWGEYLPASHNGGLGDAPERVGKKAAGCLLDGVEWKQFPELVQ
jgi:protein gp37